MPSRFRHPRETRTNGGLLFVAIAGGCIPNFESVPDRLVLMLGGVLSKDAVTSTSSGPPISPAGAEKRQQKIFDHR